MAGVPLPPPPSFGPGGGFHFGRGSGDKTPPRRASTSGNGKGGVSGNGNDNSFSSGAARRFTQTSFSSSRASGSSSRGGSVSRGATNQPGGGANGVTPGEPNVGLEDWPKIPNAAGRAAGKSSPNLPRDFGTYTPSPETIRSGSWPYNYVSGGSVKPSPIGGSANLTSGRVPTGRTNFPSGGVSAGTRSSLLSSVSNGQPRMNFPSSNAGGDKYFASARSTLGKRVSPADTTFGAGSSSSSSRADVRVNLRSTMSTSRVNAIETSGGTSATSNVRGTSSINVLDASGTSGGNIGTESFRRSPSLNSRAAPRVLKPQGRITGRGGRVAKTTVTVADLGVNPLGWLPTATVITGTPLLFMAVKQTPRSVRVERSSDVGAAPTYADRGAAAAAAAAAAFRDTLEKPGPELTQACADCFANPTSDGLVDILKRAFGHQGFKPGQVEVITRVLSGKSTLALLPTGAGKSLTYQLPALLFPGLTLVVSPLLALMADQLRGLPPALPGAALRSDQSISHLFAVLDEMRSGKLKVLFVSPERLLNERFLHDLKFVPGGVSLAVVDEAHCVSEWSHNFRPAYHRLGQILKQRLNLAGPVLALTATATHRTEISLRASLGIPAEGAFRNDAIRGNLVLSAMRVPASAREATLNHLLMKHPMNGTGSVIVYVAFQNQAETVAAYLQTNGVNAKAYHAGQDAKDRHRTQGQFFSGSVRVVVATVAFGMGLDKSDVRCVVNYSLPRSPEAYIQQAGRAGRDGHGARCISFIDQDDFVRLRSLSHADGVDECGVRKLLELVFLSGSSSGKGKKVEGGGTTSVGGVDGDVTNTKANDDSAPPQKEKARPVGALIVSQIERDVDMRGEVIETVLSCLELWRNDEWSEVSDASSVGLLKVLPDVRATCELSFHGGGGVDALAVKCPLVKAVLEISAKPRAGVYRFSIAAAARAMGADLEEVQNQLQALSANGEGAYRLTDRAVGYEILKTPPRDVRPLAKALAAHLTNVEQCAVSKLDTVYAALELAANCETDETQSAILRVTLQAYLGAPPGGGIDDGMGYGTADDTRGEGPVDTTGTGGTPSETVSRVSAVIANEPPRGLVQDVRELLTHRSGGKAGGAGCMSARAVARILYGLNSPAYPAQEWRRKEKAGHLWEKHAKVRFSTIMQIASEELLAMRGVVPKKK
jgi:ATP-dependent DNA helicase Q4